MKKLILITLSLFSLTNISISAQEKTNNTRQEQSKKNNSYWQQHVNYNMEIDMDVKKYQYKGKQHLTYTNNSPDTLKKVFF